MENAPPRPSRLERWHVAAALHTFHLLAALVAANLICWAILAVFATPATTPPNPAHFPKDQLRAAYGDLPMDVVEGTLEETWSKLPLEAAPWVHFRERAFAGKYVNVSPEGVRANGPPEPAPPGGSRPFRVLVLGGSTTFGYGVPDRETLPAHLERSLRRRHPDRVIVVENHGRSSYYSTQEVALLQSLLRRGVVADVVVFLDGLNEVTAAYTNEAGTLSLDEPAHMDRLRAMWQRDTTPEPPRLLPGWLPIVEVADRLAARLRGSSRAAVGSKDRTPHQEAESLLQLYLENRRIAAAIAADRGMAALFVWQPVPFVAYDRSRSPLSRPYGHRVDEVFPILYEAFAKRSEGTLDLSTMLRDYAPPAYVDICHYTPAVNALIAERIAERVEVTSR